MTRWPPGAEKVRACLRRFGVRGAAVDDLTQDVYVIAYRRHVELTDGWLCETARKLAANYRRLRRHEYEQASVEEARVEPMEPELRVDVHRALDELDPVDAELLVRHVLGGESLTEIARDLGLTKGRAYGKLTAARRRFEEKIG